MGQILSLGLVYVCCSSAASLCQSCFGTTAAGTSGRKRSVLLLSIAIVMALWFQYYVGPSIVKQDGWIWKTYRAIPGTGKLVYGAWKDGCEQYGDDDHPDDFHVSLAQCAGNAGVYRSTFLATLYFVTFAIASKVVPSLNREAWPAKYALFFFILLIFMFIPNNPLFTGFYLWLARIGAAFFVVMQQIILIDVAYNWNDDWVERANMADRISYGSGSGWLQAIVGTCISFYLTSFISIGVLYSKFDDCPENTWVITLTLLAILGMTTIQLTSSDGEGSLLTSSFMSLYATYLCFSIVSHNPNGKCNPLLGHNDTFGIIVGLFLTTVSLAWTGWSWSAEGRLSTVESVSTAKAVAPAAGANGAGDGDGLNLDVPFLDPDDAPATGVVTSGASSGNDDMGTSGIHIWKLNVVMALISCYVAMILTGWGTIPGALVPQDDDGGNDDSASAMNAANPMVGRVNMAILGVSQWLAIGLYCWTLVAPRICPDRDFS